MLLFVHGRLRRVFCPSLRHATAFGWGSMHFWPAPETIEIWLPAIYTARMVVTVFGAG